VVFLKDNKFDRMVYLCINLEISDLYDYNVRAFSSRVAKAF